jgi:hypothetical protein
MMMQILLVKGGNIWTERGGTQFWMTTHGASCWLSGMGMSGKLEGLWGLRDRFRKFREFEDMANKVVDKLKDKEQKVLKFCTGGIRC